MYPAKLAMAIMALVPTILVAQEPQPSLPLTPTRPLEFSTDEGTWMSVDISPDGKTILFDLLGDLYSLPASGGKATRLTEGTPFDSQPRFAPDGRTVVFVSDRDGSDNLWLMDANGSNPRPLTKGNNWNYFSPRWTPDGAGVVVSRTADGGKEMRVRQYQISGGTGIDWVTPGESGGFAATPFVDPSGKYLYYAMYRGSTFDRKTFQIERLELANGTVLPQSEGRGGGFLPLISPDGRWMVYASEIDGVTGLRLRELATQDERWLLKEIDRNLTNGYEPKDLLPGYAFTPDSKALIMSKGGKIARLELANSALTNIPFQADVKQMLGPLVRHQHPIENDVVTVHQIRYPRVSPDGKRAVFTAADQLYLMDLPNGTPKRIAPMTAGQFWPVWSPDGRSIAFVTWKDSEGGFIYSVSGNGGTPKRLTSTSGFYEKLNYAPDGKRLVFLFGSRAGRTQSLGNLSRPGLMGVQLAWLPSSGGEPTKIIPIAESGRDGGYGWPHFGSDPNRILVLDPKVGLVSVRFDGLDKQILLQPKGSGPAIGTPNFVRSVMEFIVAPSGGRALALFEEKLYLIDLPKVFPSNLTVTVTEGDTGGLPLRIISKASVETIDWRPDGRSFYYSSGPNLFHYDLELAKNNPKYEPVRTAVKVTLPSDRPEGSIVLRNARIVTMKGDEVIERGDILVTRNRIAAIGAAGTLSVPAGATSLDVSGKTIVPGWVDGHAHLGSIEDIHRDEVWQYQVNLAYGVTAARDPQSFTDDIFTYRDLVATGKILGPRLFSTGPGHWSGNQIRSLEDARDVLRRNSADYLFARTAKQYRTGDRKVRQWFYQAANEFQINPTNESGMDYRWQLTMIQDGSAGIEHAIDVSPLYKDVLELLRVSQTTYTPTLAVSGPPGSAGEDYFVQRYDVHDDPRMVRFMPHSKRDDLSMVRKAWVRDGQYHFLRRAQVANDIVQAGGRVAAASHGNVQGLGIHFDMWAFVLGGMKPHDALRTGTIFPATAIGLGDELGSLEVGKLADLQVLDENPLADIHNTRSTHYVMKNGRLFEAATLSEVWPQKRENPPSWWNQAELQ